MILLAAVLGALFAVLFLVVGEFYGRTRAQQPESQYVRLGGQLDEEEEEDEEVQYGFRA